MNRTEGAPASAQLHFIVNVNVHVIKFGTSGQALDRQHIIRLPEYCLLAPLWAVIKCHSSLITNNALANAWVKCLDFNLHTHTLIRGRNDHVACQTPSLRKIHDNISKLLLLANHIRWTFIRTQRAFCCNSHEKILRVLAHQNDKHHATSELWRARKRSICPGF